MVMTVLYALVWRVNRYALPIPFIMSAVDSFGCLAMRGRW